MEFTVAEIAQKLSAEVVGNPEAIIKTVCKIEEGVPGGLSFLANPKYTHYIYETRATAVIVNKSFEPERPVSATLIKVQDAYLAFASLLQLYNTLKSKKSGISPQAYVSPKAKVGQNVYIGEFASIGDNAKIGDNVQIYPQVFVGDNVVIGDDTVLYAGVKIYAECVVGNQCIIHAGAVIGADGFGFASQENSFLKIPQIGNVVIEDNVEIGANSCVDRATMGSTYIRKNAKLDNLVQIAHNVDVGEASAFAAQCGVAGTTKIGNNCLFGGKTAINGHITIGNNVRVGACSGILTSVNDDEILFGSPAIPLRDEQKLIILRRKLPELYDRVKKLEKEIKSQK
jgi:UDP-3-O-[3-hydroxymyristoyl] glucosamine N-acyltransferase